MESNLYVRTGGGGGCIVIEKRELIDTIDQAILFALSNLHTATIARVESVAATTIDVKPVINRVVDGRSIELPLFTKVPPLFMQGGGSYTAHPITAGDYCLLILTERCFDRWYDGQDNQPPAEFRMHDYSDGVAIVGINPRAGALTIPSVITQIGDTYQSGTYTHDGDMTQTGNLIINGDLTVNGNIGCTGTLTVASATIGGIDFGTHVHAENDNGGPTDGPQ